MRINFENAAEKLKIIENICQKLGYEYDSVPKNELEIPTILISTEKNYKDNNITVSCNLMPMYLGGIDVLFLQYYTCLNEEIDQSRRKDVEEFIKRQNESFMIGNVLEFMDSVCMKHVLYLDPEEPFDEVLFARTLDIFTFQANALTKKLDDVISGEATVDKVISAGTFF